MHDDQRASADPAPDPVSSDTDAATVGTRTRPAHDPLNLEEVTTPPRDAASVVLLRDGADGGLEVLLMRRHDASDVLGGVHVFPGGKVDPADAQAALPEGRERELIDRLGEPTLSDAGVTALYAAAARETREEAAVAIELHALYPWSRWITPRIPAMMR